MDQVSQAQVDEALVACLRIFARRGRELREQRERALAMNDGTTDSQSMLILADITKTTAPRQVDTISPTPQS